LLNPKGIDIARLIEIKNRGGSVTDYPEGRKIHRDAVVEADCDILIPAARPDVLRADNAGRVRARLVVPGANIPATPEAEAILHDRKILMVPDFVANAGGVICCAVEYRGGTESQAFAMIEERIRATTRAVLDESARTGRRPHEVAVGLAERRVRDAMRYRR
jgi:glutamate dehydrogenase/leucine dehydrogenase